MNIKDNWKIDDEVSGLLIKVVPGDHLNKLQIRSAGNQLVRDFWFTKDGTFDGTEAFIEDGFFKEDDADSVSEDVVNGKEV